MRRNEDALEPQLLSLCNSLFNSCHRTYLAAQTYFASHADIALDGHVAIARKHSGYHAEVDCGVGDAQSSSYVQEDILLGKFEADTLLQYCKEHVQASSIKACRASLSSSVGCRADQSLRLYQERPHTFY